MSKEEPCPMGNCIECEGHCGLCYRGQQANSDSLAAPPSRSDDLPIAPTDVPQRQ